MRNKQLIFEGLDNAESIGLKLRAARLNHGLSLQDVSKKLNISMRYLSEMEAGQFDGLPGSVYVTGFLRSYANLVDLDADNLLAIQSYNEQRTGDLESKVIMEMHVVYSDGTYDVVSTGKDWKTWDAEIGRAHV